MSITYEEALATLEAMFGEPWNRDLLDSVLRNQKGHMENTCDLILRHGDKDPQILVDQLEAGIDPMQSAVAVDEALARQLSQGSARTAAAATAAPGTARSGKGKQTTLPDDFLRVPGFVPAPNSISDDEALARMLQDELFTEELRRNPDFAHLARGRSNATRPTNTRRSSANNPTAGISNAFNEFASRFQQRTGSGRNIDASNNSIPQSPNVMDKVSALTDNAKRRLQMLAAQFNAANQQGSSPQHSATAAHERRGLLDDDDDNMELAARKDL